MYQESDFSSYERLLYIEGPLPMGPGEPLEKNFTDSPIQGRYVVVQREAANANDDKNFLEIKELMVWGV